VHCTLKGIVEEAPPAREGAVVGRHVTQPGASRHGGLRTAGKFKRGAADGGKPLVTVITVCLNAARTIEQCMRSVFAQSYPNVEYLVIDGASTDGTIDLLKKHEHAIDYWLSEPDQGLYQAMNKGLALSSGDYVLILNADDWYRRDCIESLVKAQGYGGTDFVAALAQYVDDSGAPVEQMRSMPLDDSALLRMPLRHESMLVPAALYERVGGYDESLRICADFQFVTRLYRAGCTVYELQQPLLYFRNTGISNSDAALELAERARVIRESFPFLSEREAGTLADVRRLTPEHLVAVAMAHPGHTELLHALQAYLQYRRRTAQRSTWAECERNWPKGALPRPRISVILTVYNGESTLAASIESVLAQSFGDFELICVDDRSTDGSWQILAGFQARDPRIVVLKNDVNLGHGGTRNRGVQLARGAYVFHIDPDDTIPPDALEALYTHALEHGCDVVKGAYWRERQHFEQKGQPAALVNRRPKGAHPAGNRLAQIPELLDSTEGHWSCLYRRDLARRIPYGGDLRMGEDSIFVVRVLLQADNIGFIDKVVYRYQANPSSAMNTFTHRKYMDGLEWRRRAWHVLADAGMNPIGERILRMYWRDSFFADLASKADPAQFREFCEKLRVVFTEANLTFPDKPRSGPFRLMFSAILAGLDDEARRLMREGAGSPPSPRSPKKMRVATLCTQDTGGAGTGSQRRVDALRRNGVDARLLVLLSRSGRKYVRKLPGFKSAKRRQVWDEIRERAILPAERLAGYRASEMFSLTESVVDFRNLRSLFDRFDVIHLHWVVGMLDYEHVGEVLGDKPIVWTLADMNAFTGGCHYSEGCEEYKRECRRCPLLGGKSDLAHEGWQKKKRAYSQLRNVRIVCPSPWLAERARESSLLGDREIQVIPNAYPLDTLKLTSKIVARIRLGLPLRKKLLIFGADSLTSHRKGGDLLKAALQRYGEGHAHDNVEIVVFGNKAIDLPLPVRPLGYIESEKKLALAYSAADGYLFPSREDNAPLTVGEALLCGTPVVAFPVGNVPDLVQHKVNGYLAKHLNVADFARGIAWVLDAAPETALARSARCRIHASAVHDPALAAARHKVLYRRAISDSR